MALVQYSSSEAEDSDNNEVLESPSAFLEAFDGDAVRLSSSKANILEDSCSEKRVRSFAHQHGNWATSVFIPGIYSCIFSHIFSVDCMQGYICWTQIILSRQGFDNNSMFDAHVMTI